MDISGYAARVQLDGPDTGCVEDGGHCCAGGGSPADDGCVACGFEGRNRLDGESRPGQLGADQGTAEPVEEQVLDPLLDGGRSLVEGEAGNPGS